jgi:branched-subunit amino acid transport protein
VNVVLAVAAVGLGSLAFRLVPLVTGRQVPAVVARAAGWAGLAVIAGITVRSTVLLEDPSVPLAPVLAVLSVALGLVIAFRGRSVLVAVGVGCAVYVVTAAALAGVG